MWADLCIIINEDNTYTWKYPASVFNYGMSEHSVLQTGGAFLPLYHLKIHSPYMLRCRKDISFYFSQAVYSHNHYENRLLMPSGAVSFKNQPATHINCFFEVGKQYDFIAGQPMMYITPMTEKRVVFKHHVLTTSEYEDLKKKHYPNKFNGYYKDLNKRRKGQ